MTRRLASAFRRAERSDALQAQCRAVLEARHATAAGDRLGLNAAALSLASRAAAWVALAGGDVDAARDHHREALTMARIARRQAAREAAHGLA